MRFGKREGTELAEEGHVGQTAGWCQWPAAGRDTLPQTSFTSIIWQASVKAALE